MDKGNAALSERISKAMKIAIVRLKQIRKSNKILSQITELMGFFEEELKKSYENVYLLVLPAFNTQDKDRYEVALKYGPNKCCIAYLFRFETKDDSVIFDFLPSKKLSNPDEIDKAVLSYFRDRNNLIHITSFLRKRSNCED